MSGRIGDGWRRLARLTSAGLAVLVLAAAFTGCAPPPRAHAQSEASEAPKTRTLAWTGGDKLWVAVPADVRYVQGPDNKVTITGPTRLVDRIEIDGGTIRYEDMANGKDWWMWWRWGHWMSWRGDRMKIQVVAPGLTEARLSGSGRLDLGRLSQDRLDLGVSGSGLAEASGAVKSLHVGVSGSGGAKLNGLSAGDVSADISGSGWIQGSGTASKVRVSISGSGWADMGALAVDDAEASISGSGSARLAPKQSADVGVSGSGHIKLETEPAHLSTHKSGSGWISHPGGTAS
jgi:hypothetical protein